MNKLNYPQIYAKLTKGLSPKTKDIFSRRFGIKSKSPETLELIGDSMGITRERVRQIEEAGFNFVKKQNKETLDNVFAEFADYFKNNGEFKKEEIVLQELGGKNYQPYVLFLLTLGDQFSKVCEKKDFYYFWSTMVDARNKVEQTLKSLVSALQKIGSPMSKEEFLTDVSVKCGLQQEALFSYLEVSKKIQDNKEGKIGLTDWPEIKPRGVKDKSFLVFKKHQKPLHFTMVAELIDQLGCNQPNKKTFPQTVHNELIKDQRFVLVGRGTYALKEWGYEPGTIKDVIKRVLQSKNQPTDKEEIVKEVLAQRLVAQNTVLMNLNNKKYFAKDEQGKYSLRKTQTA
ncbi:MAG: HTH domain-containing protein [bacterium]|nr:HTH domain-containing protein [bacterium]